MSNSNLVTYTKLSPNMNAPRNQPISKSRFTTWQVTTRLSNWGKVFQSHAGKQARTTALTATERGAVRR